MLVTKSFPNPPYSSGTDIPKIPKSPAFSIKEDDRPSSCFSILSIIGSISLSIKS
jgi:hypothetical protein